MKVFISYRRKDSHYIADRIYDWLEREFGRENVFKDVDAIPLGRDFRHILQDGVTRCDALLAVIGPRWLNETDAVGRRRVDDPEDWVRIEIETALERDIPVIPLLVDGASFPHGEELPSSLRGLIYRNGMLVRPDPDFRHDMGRLIKALRATVPGVSSTASPEAVPEPGPNAVKIADEPSHRTLTGHTDTVESVAFSPDGSTLASGSADKTVRLWRVADGSLLHLLEGHMDTVWSVAFSPDGSTLASGSADKTIRLWRVADGNLLHFLEGLSVTRALWSSGETAWLWRVWDPSVAFSPDGLTRAEGSGGATIQLWRWHDLRLMSSVTDVSDIPTVGLSLIIVAVVDHVLHFRIFDGDGKMVVDTDEKRLTEQAQQIEDLRKQPQQIEDLRKQLESLWPPHELTKSERARIIAAATSIVDHILWRVSDWRVSDRSLLCELKVKGHKGWIPSFTKVAFSPDGSTLASGLLDKNKTVRLWWVADGSPRHTLEGHMGTVWSVAFSPDGSTLASASADTTVRLWRVVDGSPRRTLEGHTGSVLSVAFSPDGSTLASGSADTTVQLWRVSDTRFRR